RVDDVGDWNAGTPVRRPRLVPDRAAADAPGVHVAAGLAGRRARNDRPPGIRGARRRNARAAHAFGPGERSRAPEPPRVAAGAARAARPLRRVSRWTTADRRLTPSGISRTTRCSARADP